MSQTVRQMMIEILRNGPVSAKDISALVGVSEKDIFPHLEHIRKSLHHGPHRLLMEPARCNSCGFVFHKRERFSKPGRCPACSRSFIDEPCFMIRGYEGCDGTP
jgi:predicted Zn-ribbon and HTH transcriptional regulator